MDHIGWFQQLFRNIPKNWNAIKFCFAIRFLIEIDAYTKILSPIAWVEQKLCHETSVILS